MCNSLLGLGLRITVLVLKMSKRIYRDCNPPQVTASWRQARERNHGHMVAREKIGGGGHQHVWVPSPPSQGFGAKAGGVASLKDRVSPDSLGNPDAWSPSQNTA